MTDIATRHTYRRRQHVTRDWQPERSWWLLTALVIIDVVLAAINAMLLGVL